MIKENNQTLVLVTGGTGFVGIHAIHQLLQKSYQVKTKLRSLNRKDENQLHQCRASTAMQATKKQGNFWIGN
ncbi:GDP-mannose 4,6-dehydratase [Pedobacter cryoconitis]|uniref:GDP-mannose 4,6-dehydratase n=1 Tax=Pedobacter cryoconitis TaxID=188932 RepID=UPI000DBA5C7E|nr:GDP-mannose 4,6-dehydratase [Pedobacter cryoconitis]